MEGALDDDRPAVARLARFDADQVRAIEAAIADHLAVDTRFLDQHGFNVTPDGAAGMTIEWRSSARLDSATFSAIVARATEGGESGDQRWREHLPEPAGALARPRRFRRRRRPGEDAAGTD